MKPAYLQKHSISRDRWMVSYLDVLTILLIFFVAMAAQTLHSAPKPAPAAPPAIAAAPEPAPAPTPNTGLAAVQQALEKLQLDVRLEPRGVVVSLPQALLYPPGDDQVSNGALETMSAIGDVLSKIPNNVSLVGHADATPIHNNHFRNNWELAAARGLRLLELLSSKYGISEARLSVESYGAYDPRSTNDTPDGRASNRRVEIVIQDNTPKKL